MSERTKNKHKYVTVSRIRALAKANDRQVSAEFLARLDVWIEMKVLSACSKHNRGRKRLDGAMADYVLGTLPL